MSLSGPLGLPSKRAESTYDASDVMVITCSLLALYNSFELLAIIFTTFKQRQGLYFWSLLLATFGVIPYVTGWLFDYLDLLQSVAGRVLNNIGWVLLITGQSVVLYSRLHLVLNDPAILRGIRYIIIANACIWHTTMTVLVFVMTSGPSRKGSHTPPVYYAIEKTQLTCFCVQEFILSGLYIWKIMDILRTSLDRKRRFMWHLFFCNIIIVIMDIALLVVIFTDHFLIEQGIKVVIYSLKLKLEFATLSNLVDFVKRGGGSQDTRPDTSHHTSGNSGSPSTKLRMGSNGEAPVPENLKRIRSRALDQPVYAPRTDEEECALDTDDMNSDQLYNVAVRHISRG
ncbi:hypothetical protein FALBO_13899 [Fusarium albosuccineum]|uniref:DUF7703 domain-containing protein n=1 Tax=Fusarium albosuccineum TaxID=1237068 RepID=A0A8H4P4Y0_9HYPO|nr:hypothetical protein FALBO_13899 [Fusarium albosuccineum]